MRVFGDDVGDQIADAVRAARREIVLAAPFIKSTVLEKLLSSVSEGVPVTCVVRWLPEDIAAGVCDLEIYEVIAARSKSLLLVNPALHGKYVRCDEKCLIGSANITRRAFGWAMPSNREIMVDLPASVDGVKDWESNLLAASVFATPQLRAAIAQRVEALNAATPPSVEADPPSDQGSPRSWLPTCPVPDRLWEVYRGQGEASMVTSARAAAQADLTALGIPAGLPYEQYRQFIKKALMGMPLVQELDRLAGTELKDEDAASLISERFEGGGDIPPNLRWNVLKDWLLFFFPDVYMVRSERTVLIRGGVLRR